MNAYYNKLTFVSTTKSHLYSFLSCYTTHMNQQESEADFLNRIRDYFSIPMTEDNQVNWTSQYPTQPGFYWIRNYLIKVDERWTKWEEPSPGPDFVEVVDNLGFYGVGCEVKTERNEIISAEWLGPISPPQEDK